MLRTFALLALVWLLPACADHGSDRPQRQVPAASPAFAVEIARPRVLAGLPIGPLDHAGQPTVAPCRTCHAADAGVLPDTARELKGPHVGLRVTHGALRCASCHASNARDELHLADGRQVPLRDAMLLCSQCHGPQKRSYDHGAHGGMRGYWDLSRGGRQRNHCLSCHDPHAPQFGVFMPAPGPQDRFPEMDEGDTQ